MIGGIPLKSRDEALLAKSREYLARAYEARPRTGDGDRAAQLVQAYPGETISMVIVPNPRTPPFPTCVPPEEVTLAPWRDVADTLNPQFKEFGIPLEYRVVDNVTELRNQINEGGIDPDKTVFIPINECHDLGVAGMHFNGNGTIAISADMSFLEHAIDFPKRVRIHELAHMHGTHPQDIAEALDDPDIKETLCSRQIVLGSALIYEQECVKAGYYDTVLNPVSSLDEQGFGLVDLVQTKACLTSDPNERQTVMEQGAELLADAMAKLYGAHVASGFIAAAANKCLERVLMDMVARLPISESKRGTLRGVLKFIPLLVQAALLNQRVSALPAACAFTAMRSGCFGKSVQAVALALTEAGLVETLLRAIRGNADALMTTLGSYLGARAGEVVGDLFNALTHACKAPTQTQRDMFLESIRDLKTDAPENVPASCM
ncbi:MAG: hypothetical protein Q7U62_09615, partial [Burkholderiaceae bacterium]|nr:hypothetical protein [Burkholderiaceae bacterium]